MALWRPLPVTEQAVGGFRGLHEYLSPVDRPLGTLSAVSNLVHGPGTALVTRPGLTLIGGAAVAAAATRGIVTFQNLAGTTVQVLAQAGAQLSRLNGSAWTSIAAGATNGNFEAANINNILCIFYKGAAAQSWDGTTLGALGGSPPQGGCVVEAYDTLFVCDIPGREGDLDWCDTGAPTTWAPAATNNAGSLSVCPERLMWVGFAKEQGQVVLWSRYALYVLSGPETPNRSELWSVETVDMYGTPVGRSVRRCANRWIWLTDAGGIPAFAMWSGGRVETVREPIRTSLALIDWANVGNTASYIDADGRYVCKVPATVGGMIDFIYDAQRGWTTGISLDARVGGWGRIGGVDVPLMGDEVGKVYQCTGTTNNGTAISWSATIGPSLLQNNFRQKQILDSRWVLSLATGATATAATSLSDTGSFGTTATLTATAALTQVKLVSPFAAGEAVRGAALRMQVAGTGVATLHDVLIRAYQGAN